MVTYVYSANWFHGIESIFDIIRASGGIGGILLRMGKIKTPAIKKVKEGSS